MARSGRGKIRKAPTQPQQQPTGTSGQAPTPVARKRLLPRLLGVGAVLLLLGGLLAFRPWDGNAEPAGKGGFAADREGSEKSIPFDAKRAMGYLEDVCKIGPRISGTEGMTKQQELLEKHFTAHGGKITWQRFTARQRSTRKPVEMANLVVSYQPEKTTRVILCSHYDTRPLADQEEDRKLWREPFVSANDGGSGVALLMELAHHMKDLPTEVGVDFVFFDGEEYVFDRSDEYFFGSKEFGREYAKVRRKITYRGAILLDMIAGKGGRFPVERNSWGRAAALVKDVWKIAEEQKCKAFTNGFSSVAVEDDHIALNRAGIPAIDIIDFDYAHWHRLSDVPRNCSGETMEQVARVVGTWIQRVR